MDTAKQSTRGRRRLVRQIRKLYRDLLALEANSGNSERCCILCILHEPRFHSLTPQEFTVAGQRSPTLSQLSMVNNTSTTSLRNNSQRMNELDSPRGCSEKEPEKSQSECAVSKKEQSHSKSPTKSAPKRSHSRTSKGSDKKKTDTKDQCLRCLNSRDFYVRTDIIVKGYGAIPVIKGDPKILPAKVQLFVAEKAALLRPRAIYICDGSFQEHSELIGKLDHRGVMTKLSNYTNVFVTRTDPRDVARMEHKTFIVSEERSQSEVRFKEGVKSEVARWMAPLQYSAELEARFPASMRGRTMYVVPFSMGPIGGKYSMSCVELTDSPYVVVNMHKTTRISLSVWDAMGTNDFVKCIHSVGVPRPHVMDSESHPAWNCNPERILVAQDQDRREIWSYGSGYGGNSLLGKKGVALRLASRIGKEEGWLAEHMAILGVTNPKGEEFFVAAAFPSGCGKTNLALMEPSLEGWKVKVIGDDIAWLRFGDDGKMYASNPENGMFGVAAESNEKTNPIVLKMCQKNTFLTNVATTSNGKFFWQGLEENLGAKETVTDWRGKPWRKGSKTNPAHPNSRFTVQMNQCPTAHELWDSPKGVPISAILFGARRTKGFPLVYECFSWQHGVFTGASIRTEPAAAFSTASAMKDCLIADPMGMRAFMGYNFADYLKHWLSLEKPGRKMPKIFGVNWFRTSSSGELLWPGFAENIRVLEWIQKRCDANSSENTNESPIGLIPEKSELSLENLTVDWEELMSVPKPFWLEYAAVVKAYFDKQLNEEMPDEINAEMQKLISKINEMP